MLTALAFEDDDRERLRRDVVEIRQRLIALLGSLRTEGRTHP